MTELKLSNKRYPGPTGQPASHRLADKPVARPTGWSPSAWRGGNGAAAALVPMGKKPVDVG